MKNQTRSQVASLLIACLLTSGLVIQSQVFSQSVHSVQLEAINNASPASPTVNNIDPGNLFSKKSYIDAGENTNVCLEDGSYILSGTSTYSWPIFWLSSGDGEFSDPTSLNSTYTPGDYDISIGKVTLYLYLNNPCLECPPIFDTTILSFVSCTGPVYDKNDY